MKKFLNAAKSMFVLLFLLTSDLFVFAQEKVNINGHDVGTWFKYNWMWVAGAVVLLLIIISFTSSRSRRKTTTIVKDNYGDTKRIITTEEVD